MKSSLIESLENEWLSVRSGRFVHVFLTIVRVQCLKGFPKRQNTQQLHRDKEIGCRQEEEEEAEESGGKFD